MAKEVKEIEMDELETEEAAEAVEEKTAKTKKERKKLSRGKKIGLIAGGLGLGALGVLLKVMNKRGYNRGVSDTTDYYTANPNVEYVYLPAADETEETGAIETVASEVESTME